jgi:hypothetical protein
VRAMISRATKLHHAQRTALLIGAAIMECRLLSDLHFWFDLPQPDIWRLARKGSESRCPMLIGMSSRSS